MKEIIVVIFVFYLLFALIYGGVCTGKCYYWINVAQADSLQRNDDLSVVVCDLKIAQKWATKINLRLTQIWTLGSRAKATLIPPLQGLLTKIYKESKQEDPNMLHDLRILQLRMREYNVSNAEIDLSQQKMSDLWFRANWLAAKDMLDVISEAARTTSVTAFINILSQYCFAANYSLSDTEIKKIDASRKQGYVVSAKGLLQTARNNDNAYQAILEIQEVQKYIKLGTSYDEIGITEQDLQELLEQRYFAEARNWLAWYSTKSSKQDLRYGMNRVIECATKSGHTLAEVRASMNKR